MSNLTNKDRRSITVGDIVTVNVFFRDPLTARVIESTKLFGKNAVPLLVLDGHDPENERRIFDAAHVTEVVSREYICKPKKRNVFRNFRTSSYESPRDLVSKGYLRTYGGCDISYLACYVLGGLPYEIDRELNRDRTNQLWVKDGCPGLIQRARLDSFTYSSLIREKPFQQWVAKNWSQLINTVAEENVLANKHNSEQERLEMEDMEYMDQMFYDVQAQEERDYVEDDYDWGPDDY